MEVDEAWVAREEEEKLQWSAASVSLARKKTCAACLPGLREEGVELEDGTAVRLRRSGRLKVIHGDSEPKDFSDNFLVGKKKNGGKVAAAAKGRRRR